MKTAVIGSGMRVDFWSTIRILLRRWYVALPVFALALGLAGAVYVSVDTEFESTGTIVLTAPSTGARVSVGQPAPAERINPLLAFDGSLTTSAQIVIENLKDPATAEQFEDVAGAKAGYEIGNGQLDGPFIVVVATSSTPDGAQQTVAKVLERAKEELSARQESLDAPESTYIRAQSVINPTPAEALVGGKVRFAAVALLLGLFAGLTSAYGFESYHQHRKRKPRKTAQSAKTPEAMGAAEPVAAKSTDRAQPEKVRANGSGLVAAGDQTTRIIKKVAPPARSFRAGDQR